MANTQDTILGPQTIAVVSKSEHVPEKRLRRMIAEGYLRAFRRSFDNRGTLLIDPSDVRAAMANALVQYVPRSQPSKIDGRKKAGKQKHPMPARRLHPDAAAMTR